MTDAYLQQSALSHLHLKVNQEQAANAHIHIRDRGFFGQFCLRGNCTDIKFLTALKKTLKIDLPINANTSAGNPSATHILWIGPDEWLIMCKPEMASNLYAKLDKALTGIPSALIDVSDSRVIIEVSGTHARQVLMKGTPLDLHPSVFMPGQCAGTILEQAHVTIHQTAQLKGGTSRYDIFVHRSFADYLWRWLEDAAAEYV